MLDLSIIIPIYNTPIPVLTRCLNSLATITGITFETLLVDDGSAPSTADFCTQYAQEHPGFRCLHKENGGVSSARNLGLSNAQGQYVLFVDADDELIGDALSAPLTADLILFDAHVTDGSNQQLLQILEDAAPDREMLLKKLLTTKTLNTPWAKLYRRTLLEQHAIRFPEDFVTGEDWMFVCNFVLHCETVSYRQKSCYRYYLDNNNTRTRAARHPDKIIDNQLARFAKKQEIAHTEQWTGCTGDQLMSLAARELIENLFNTATDLLLEKVFTKPRKEKLFSAAKAAGALLLPPIPKKTRLKLTVLCSMRFALRPMAMLRAAYLKKH